MKSLGLTETKLFHFHRIFKNGRWPLDHCVVILKEVAGGLLPNP